MTWCFWRLCVLVRFVNFMLFHSKIQNNKHFDYYFKGSFILVYLQSSLSFILIAVSLYDNILWCSYDGLSPKANKQRNILKTSYQNNPQLPNKFWGFCLNFSLVGVSHESIQERTRHDKSSKILQWSSIIKSAYNKRSTIIKDVRLCWCYKYQAIFLEHSI